MKATPKKLQQCIDTIGDRFEAIIDNLEHNQSSFSRELGHKYNSTINNIVVKKTVPSYETLLEVIMRFDINPYYLLTGEGDMFAKPRPAKKINPEEKTTINGMLKFMSDTITSVREECMRDKAELYKTNETYRSILIKHKLIPTSS